MLCIWIKFFLDFYVFVSKILKERNYLLYALDRVIKITQVYFSFSGYGLFSLGLFVREYLEQRKKAVIKITATSCWSPACLWCVQRTKSSTCWSQATSATLSQTHTPKKVGQPFHQTPNTVSGENSELRAASCFYLKLEMHWASFKKEEIKDKLSFPF